MNHSTTYTVKHCAICVEKQMSYNCHQRQYPKWAMHLALKMRWGVGRASLTGNKLQTKTQREQSTSTEPRRKTVQQLQRSKTQISTGVRQEYKGGWRSWEPQTVIKDTWYSVSASVLGVLGTTGSTGAISHPALKQASATQLGKKKWLERKCGAGTVHLPTFPARTHTSIFMEKLLFLLLLLATNPLWKTEKEKRNNWKSNSSCLI